MRAVSLMGLTLLLVSFNVFASCGGCDSCCGDEDTATIVPVRGYWQCVNASADRECNNYTYIQGYNVSVTED